jgi:hypothetical protein
MDWVMIVLLSGDYGGSNLIGSRTVRPRSTLENGCFEAQFSLFSAVLSGIFCPKSIIIWVEFGLASFRAKHALPLQKPIFP